MNTQSYDKGPVAIFCLLVIFLCISEQASAYVSTRIDIKKAEVASNGMVALETTYSIRDQQIRLLDPIQKRIFARIKIDNVEDGSYFSNLLADDNRFVFQLKNNFSYSGIYTVDSSVEVKKLGSVKYKLQLATKNWFLFTKDDEYLSPVRYDKDLKGEFPGHIPGHPGLIALNGQREREGIWLACIKIAKPQERFTSIKAKLFLVYLADDDTSSVYPVGVVEEIGHQKVYIAVSDNEVWLSADSLHVFDKETKAFRHYSSSYRSVAYSWHGTWGVLMTNYYELINIEGNEGRPLFVRPKIKHQMTPLIQSSNRVVHNPRPRREVPMIQSSRRIVQYNSVTGEETVINIPPVEPKRKTTPTQPGVQSENTTIASTIETTQQTATGSNHNPLMKSRPPSLPEDRYQLINWYYLKEKLAMPNIEPLFVYDETLWCKASRDGDEYWVRLNLESGDEPEIAQMKKTFTEKLAAGAKLVGEIIVSPIFIFTGPM
jgi:hypothetical protein